MVFDSLNPKPSGCAGTAPGAECTGRKKGLAEKRNTRASTGRCVHDQLCQRSLIGGR